MYSLVTLGGQQIQIPFGFATKKKKSITKEDQQVQVGETYLHLLRHQEKEVKRLQVTFSRY